MASRLIHPRMLVKLQRDFFTQTCALKEPSKVQDTAGEEIVTHATRTGYEAIPCRLAPARGGERRTREYVYSETTHLIVLVGQFHDLTEEWVAEVDGQEYEILLPSEDGEGQMTHLECRLVR